MRNVDRLIIAVYTILKIAEITNLDFYKVNFTFSGGFWPT